MEELFDVQIKDVVKRTHNVKSLRLSNKMGMEFKAGQFVFVSFDGSKELGRYLSISNSPTEKGYIEVTKKLTDSSFSDRVDAAGRGQIVKISSPKGNFIYDEKDKKIAFLSGGIGITPIRSITKYICDSGFATEMTLIYGNHEEHDIAFKDDLDQMTWENPNFKVVNLVCVKNDNWKGRTGYIDKHVIVDEIPDYKERKVFLCGPPGMVKSLKSILTEGLGIREDMIVTENFAGY